MIVIGADSHERTHTVVGVDQVGRRVGEWTVKTTSDGHLALLRWSAQWPEVTFALEDCRHLTRRLEEDLLRAGLRDNPLRGSAHSLSLRTRRRVSTPASQKLAEPLGSAFRSSMLNRGEGQHLVT